MISEMRSHGLATAMLPQLQEVWKERTVTLARERYEAYGDLLYAYLLERLVPQKVNTFNALVAAMQTATSPRDIETPLWQYTACYYKTEGERLFDTQLGTRTLMSRALPLVSVYTVTHSTDILPRLASAYGADFYVYDRHVEILSETDQRVQSRRELVLAYYPFGLPETLSRRVQDAYARQLTRETYTPSWAETVTLVEPTETPPQSPPSSPPRMPKRCHCEHADEE
jgi:hypothetical protein